MCVKFDKEFFRQFTTNELFNNIVDLNTIVQLLNRVERKYGSCKAVAKPDGQIVTFNQMIKDVAKVSSYFKEKNISGKHIGIYCSNGYWFEVVSLGIMASGNVACLLPISFNEQMIKEYINTLDIWTLIVDNDKIKGFEKTVHYEQLMRVDPLLNPFDSNVDKDSAAAIILTAGTTGKPKGAILSHDNLLAGTINGCYGLKNAFNQTYYCVLPLTHSFGFIRNMLTALYTGSLIYYNQNKQDIFKDLALYQPTVLVVVPALTELFLSLIKGVGLQVVGGKLQTIITGAANVSPYLAKEYTKLGIVFGPGYGMTECSNMVTGSPYADKYPDSVGLLYPDQEAKIVNGELYLRGRTLFKGYYNNPSETAKVMDNGWIKTGDLARFDENNLMYIIGRIKDIIVLPSGEKVSPEYVESKIIKLELIQDCLVYDQKNDFGNTELVCEVTLRQDVLKKLNLKGNQIKQYVQTYIDKLNKELQDYEHINKIIIRDKDFERSPAMKILRKKH